MSSITQDPKQNPAFINQFFEILESPIIADFQSQFAFQQVTAQRRGRAWTWPLRPDERKKKIEEIKMLSMQAFNKIAQEKYPDNALLLVEQYKKFIDSAPDIVELFHLACGGTAAFNQLPSCGIDDLGQTVPVPCNGVVVLQNNVKGKTSKTKAPPQLELVITDGTKKRVMFAFQHVDKVPMIIKHLNIKHTEYVATLHIRYDFFRDLFRIMQHYRSVLPLDKVDEVIEPILFKGTCVPVRRIILEYLPRWLLSDITFGMLQAY